MVKELLENSTIVTAHLEQFMKERDLLDLD